MNRTRLDRIEHREGQGMSAEQQLEPMPTNVDPRHWCCFAGPSRGDCEHFVGWPAELNEQTTDEWGVPHGWCVACFRHHQLAERDATIARQGEVIQHARDVIAGTRSWISLKEALSRLDAGAAQEQQPCRCGHQTHVGKCKAAGESCYCAEGYTDEYRQGWAAGREFEHSRRKPSHDGEQQAEAGR